MCFLVNSVTEVHQDFTITDMSFTPIFSSIYKGTTDAEFPLHEGSQVPIHLLSPCYWSGISAVFILNKKREVVSTAYKLFIPQVLHFSFSHLSVSCFSLLLPPHNKD